MSLNEETIVASYKMMNMITKGYLWYHNTPERPFENSPGSIWLINPKTKQWMLELNKSGRLLYYYKTPDSFSKYLNMEVSNFESFIKIWVEDALERGVIPTLPPCRTLPGWVEDALERGVIPTGRVDALNLALVEDALERGVIPTVRMAYVLDVPVEDALERGVIPTVVLAYKHKGLVEDVLERGVVSTRLSPTRRHWTVEDALERGVAFTNNGLEYHKKNKFVELCLSFLRKIKNKRTVS